MICIDKYQIYTHFNCQYKHFILLTEEEKQLVWSWRNDDRVRKWMYNSEIISLEKHLEFISTLHQREDCHYWLVFKNGQPYGVVNITDMDISNNSAEIGLYRNPQIQDNGGGLDFYYTFYDFLFFILDFEILKAGIAYKNEIAILLNAFLGYKKNGVKIISETHKFYLATCIKTDIKKDWKSKNNLREMLNYLKSNAFTEWKESC